MIAMPDSRTLRAVRKLERTVGEPLEKAVESQPGTDAIITLAKLANMGSNGLQWFRGGVLHAGGLATQRDVAQLQARLARIEQMLEELAHRRDDAAS